MQQETFARPVRAVALAFVLVAPAVSSAAEFCGWAKVTTACPGVPTETSTVAFCLEMEPGSGSGQLSTGAGTMELTTDWVFGSKGSYFAASAGDSGVGADMYYGTVKGTKLKGNFAEHHDSACVSTGTMTGGLVP